MMQPESAIIQVPEQNIFLKRAVTYLKVGSFLHWSSMLTLLLFLNFLLSVFQSSGLQWLLYFMLSLFFFTITVTSQLDALSRYQNYKMVKDLFYQHGFRGLLIQPFSRSSCQRKAVIVAASHLGLLTEVKKHFFSVGYRWYHIIPSVLFKNPLLLVTVGYWRTTLFVPKYNSKYFQW